MKKNCNKKDKGKVYVLASRPYIDQTAYVIEQIGDSERNAAYFYVLYDMRYPKLPIDTYCHNDKIDLICCDKLTLDMVKDATERGMYDVVVIDFIQALRYTRKKSREFKILQTMRYLKKLAKQTGVDIIVLSTVNRSFDSCEYKCPKASDISYAFAIVRYADTVVTIGMEYGGKLVYLKQIKGDKICNLPSCIYWNA